MLVISYKLFLFLGGALGISFAALLYLTIDKGFGALGCPLIVVFAVVDINNNLF